MSVDYSFTQPTATRGIIEMAKYIAVILLAVLLIGTIAVRLGNIHTYLLKLYK